MNESLIRVLLIEDNPGDVRLVEHYLQQHSNHDFVIEHVDRLQAGLDRLRSNEIDVVLLDMSLPDSDSVTTFARVYRTAPHIPIIVLTGVNDEETASRAVREGAQDFLIKKQVDGDLLNRSIRYAIERKRWAEVLQESEERYALAVRGANDGLWDWNLRTNEVYFSPRWLSMLGLDEGRSDSQHPDLWFKRVHPQDIHELQDAIQQHLDGQTSLFQSEHRILHQSGRYLWVLSRGVAVRDGAGMAYRMAGSLTDITARREVEQQLLRDAFYDSLTGLPNRALFLDRLGVSIARTHRNPSYQFAVLFLDLDRFKNINDSLGHIMGDKMLRAVAERLVPLVRHGDTVARLGGDEFAVLLDDIEENSRASLVADRILKRFSIPFDLEGHEVFTSASIGIALSTTGYDRAENVLRDADTAMYRAKSNGKGQYAVFDLQMHSHAVAVLKLENDLRRALERQEFRIHYQPIIDLDTGRIRAFEALVRWQHPDRGLVSPRSFIPTAEETGLIVQIGRFVLREACRQMAEWQRQFPEVKDLAVSVNLSSKEFMQSDLVERIRDLLEETGLPPNCLRLELTESIIMEHTAPVPEKLRRLRELGVELHIDDFGTGYSSLNYLHQLPANVLKIDRSFIRQMSSGSGRSEIIGTIVYLARNLGMTVAAEGLETAEELAHFRTLRCEYGQGFYFSKPLNHEDAYGLLAANPQW